jgi:hypothetical protein
VANAFWKTHGIDVVQVGLAHRLRTRKREDEPRKPVDSIPIMHNDRPYGVLAERMRKCFRCPTSRPATECVRQNGTEWLCSAPDRSDGNTVSVCHRDFYTPIDTGYLDVEIPNDERDDAMSIEEIQDDAEETEEEATERVRCQNINKNLAGLPVPHRQLLADLGFVDGVYEVTTDQMEQAWSSASDINYLEPLKLSQYAHNKNRLKTVRMEALKLLHSWDLDFKRKQHKYKGKRCSRYTITVVKKQNASMHSV